MNFICYSLYKSTRNSFEMYYNGAIEKQKTYKFFYPDFQIRFYVEESLKNIGDSLIKNGAEVVYKKNNINQSGMMWRFTPMITGDFDAVLFRDVDSVLSERESKLVYKWLESNKNFHIIKDDFATKYKYPILGGTFGAKKTDSYLKDVFAKKINNAEDDCFYEHDEKFLRDRVYDYIKNDTLEHNYKLNPELFVHGERVGKHNYEKPLTVWI